MVKCVLTRDIYYLPVYISQRDFSFLLPFLDPIFMSLLGPRPHIPPCVKCGSSPWVPEKVFDHVLSHPFPWHPNHAGQSISLCRSIMVSPWHRTCLVLPFTLRLLVTPNTGLKIMGVKHKRDAVKIATLFGYSDPAPFYFVECFRWA